MEAYSMDLRARIVESYLAHEGSQADLAERFKVSERWLQNLLRRRRDTGSIEPLPHGGGRQRVIRGDKEALLLKTIAEYPDATLDELVERCGVAGSRMCVARALERLDFTRKTSRSFARNNKTRRCRSNAARGEERSRTSNRGASSSSTRPTQRSHSPVFLAGRRAGNACGSTCQTDAGNRSR